MFCPIIYRNFSRKTYKIFEEKINFKIFQQNSSRSKIFAFQGMMKRKILQRDFFAKITLVKNFWTCWILCHCKYPKSWIFRLGGKHFYSRTRKSSVASMIFHYRILIEILNFQISLMQAYYTQSLVCWERIDLSRSLNLPISFGRC